MVLRQIQCKTLKALLKQPLILDCLSGLSKGRNHNLFEICIQLL